MTLNTLRDRLLLRLLSKRTRNDLWLVVLNDIESEINHHACNNHPEHVAPSLCRLADLMEEKPKWTAELEEAMA